MRSLDVFRVCVIDIYKSSAVTKSEQIFIAEV